MPSVHLGDEHYEQLRTGALRGLGEQCGGASPALHLSLVEHPSADPGFHGVLKTVMDFRSMTEADASIPVLTKLAAPNDRRKPQVGPCSVLLHRMHAINWHWEDDTFWDHTGFAIDLWQQPIQDIRLRLTEAWQTQAMHHVTQSLIPRDFPNFPILYYSKFPQNSSDASILRKCQIAFLESAKTAPFSPLTIKDIVMQMKVQIALFAKIQIANCIDTGNARAWKMQGNPCLNTTANKPCSRVWRPSITAGFQHLQRCLIPDAHFLISVRTPIT